MEIHKSNWISLVWSKFSIKCRWRHSIVRLFCIFCLLNHRHHIFANIVYTFCYKCSFSRDLSLGAPGFPRLCKCQVDSSFLKTRLKSACGAPFPRHFASYSFPRWLRWVWISTHSENTFTPGCCYFVALWETLIPTRAELNSVWRHPNLSVNSTLIIYYFGILRLHRIIVKIVQRVLSTCHPVSLNAKISHNDCTVNRIKKLTTGDTTVT